MNKDKPPMQINLEEINGSLYKPYKGTKYIIYMDENQGNYNTFYVINSSDMSLHDTIRVKKGTYVFCLRTLTKLSNSIVFLIPIGNEEYCVIPEDRGAYIYNMDTKITLRPFLHRVNIPTNSQGDFHYNADPDTIINLNSKPNLTNKSEKTYIIIPKDKKETKQEKVVHSPDSESDSEPDAKTTSVIKEVAKKDDLVIQIVSKKEIMTKAIDEYTKNLLLMPKLKKQMMDAINDYTSTV